MKGLAACMARLTSLPLRADAALRIAALDAARESTRLAQAIVPVRTGRLRASITAVPHDAGARLLSRCPYAGAVEWGSGRRASLAFLRPGAAGAAYPARAARALKEILP